MTWELIETMPLDNQFYLIKTVISTKQSRNGPYVIEEEEVGTRVFARKRETYDFMGNTTGVDYITPHNIIYSYKPTHWLKP